MIKAIIFDCFGVLYIDTPKPFNQPVADIIKRLKSDYRIGMLSNAARSFLDRFLSANHASDLFDAVLASSESRYSKPDRQIFEEMADRLGVALDEMLFIDDSPDYVAAAQSYGINCIHYQNPAQLLRSLHKHKIMV